MNFQTKAELLLMNRVPHGKLQKVLLFPLTRIIIAILFIFPIIMLNNLFSMYVVDGQEGAMDGILSVVKPVVLIGLLIMVYRFYTKFVEHRTAAEFSFQAALKEFGFGFLVGGGMVLFIVTILAIFGAYKVEEVNSPMILINRFFRYCQGSFIEDLIFTIIIFKLLEEVVGTTFAYLVVSLLFGGMHLMNDNATISGALFISIQQITLLAPFVLTRRMWMGWAVHLSWNFFQAGVFGMNNSGMDQGGFLTPQISGPDWLTGGSFGIEGSITSLIVNLLVGIFLILIAIRANQVQPFKKRKSSPLA